MKPLLIDHRSLLTALLALDVLHQRLEVRHRAVHAGQVDVVVLGNLDAVALAELHDDVEEVHAVELELLAERHVVLQLRQVFVGSDVAQDIENLLLGFQPPVMRRLR